MGLFCFTLEALGSSIGSCVPGPALWNSSPLGTVTETAITGDNNYIFFQNSEEQMKGKKIYQAKSTREEKIKPVIQNIPNSLKST